MKILVIAPHIPYPPTSGERLREYHLLKRAAKTHDIWISGFTYDPAYVAPLREICKDVITVPFRRYSPLHHLPGLIKFALQGKPLEHKFKHSDELARQLRELHAKVKFDIIQIEEPQMALYREIFPSGSHKTVLVMHNLTAPQFKRIFQVEKRLGAKLRAGLYSWQMERWEPKYLEKFDKCITVSEIEEKILLQANPRLKLKTIPNGVDTKLYPLLPEPSMDNHNLIFIGNMGYVPGADAAEYMANTILPLIRNKIPDAELWVVGRDPLPQVNALKSDIVHVTGAVPDVLPYYEKGAVSVVALRSGGGTRLKILEAMAMGRPVVSTTIGAEGLHVEHGKHLLLGDTPETFADHVVQLLQDRDKYKQMTHAARDLVVSSYDWDMLSDQMLDVYNELNQK